MTLAKDGMLFHIESRLCELAFSQIHTAFVSWFVIDVLEKECDIFNLPNMPPLRVMMTAVNQFGEDSTFP
jgi:hypothetical protein